jgi:hypothetical protein
VDETRGQYERGAGHWAPPPPGSNDGGDGDGGGGGGRGGWSPPPLSTLLFVPIRPTPVWSRDQRTIQTRLRGHHDSAQWRRSGGGCFLHARRRVGAFPVRPRKGPTHDVSGMGDAGSVGRRCGGQGLTLVHISVSPESDTWYRIPFDHSTLSISKIQSTDSPTVRPGRNPWISRPSNSRRSEGHVPPTLS